MDIAENAGFDTFHSRSAQYACLMGAILSDKYNLLYFKTDMLRNEPIEIFAFVKPDDVTSCALFRISCTAIDKYLGGNGVCNPGRGGINIDKEEPLFMGKTAVDILLSYVKQKES